MNTDKITYFITHPESINQLDLETILEIKNKFPYSSTLHTLYLKALANSNSINFESELKKSAIQINDREKLHSIINSINHNEISIEDKTTIISSSKHETTSIVETSEKVTTLSLKEKAKPISENEKPDMAKIIEEIKLKAEAGRQKKEKRKKEEVKSLGRKTEVELLDKEREGRKEEEEEFIIEKTEKLIKEAQNKEESLENISSSLDHKETIETPIKIHKIIKPKDEVDIDILAQAMEVAFELDVDNIIREIDSTPISKKELKLENKQVIETTTVKVEDLTFTDWLKLKQGKLKITKEEEHGQPEKNKLTKKEVNNLLDRFIEDEPKMARPQKKFFSPTSNAKKSLNEDDILVTETLAKIYSNQKNYDKAIKAYQQLSLLNPDKSIIFANQIKRIKEKLNQK